MNIANDGPSLSQNEAIDLDIGRVLSTEKLHFRFEVRNDLDVVWTRKAVRTACNCQLAKVIENADPGESIRGTVTTRLDPNKIVKSRFRSKVYVDGNPRSFVVNLSAHVEQALSGIPSSIEVRDERLEFAFIASISDLFRDQENIRVCVSSAGLRESNAEYLCGGGLRVFGEFDGSVVRRNLTTSTLLLEAFDGEHLIQKTPISILYADRTRCFPEKVSVESGRVQGIRIAVSCGRRGWNDGEIQGWIVSAAGAHIAQIRPIATKLSDTASVVSIELPGLEVPNLSIVLQNGKKTWKHSWPIEIHEPVAH